MRYRLGLDLGIASVGWSIIHLDDAGRPDRIVDLGVRVFNAAENPKDGKSLALPRRIARSVRRRLRRRNYRLKRITKLFIDYGLLTKNVASEIFQKKALESVWEIRSKALDYPITNEELYRAVYHICKRRGFKSNRKTERKEAEVGKLLTGISQNELYLKEKGYRTIGEMFDKDERFAERKRNTTGNYSFAVSRKRLEEELILILETQKEFGNKHISDEFISRCVEIFNSQRPFASKDMIEKLVGPCTFEENEKRAPKATYTYEYSMLLQKINSLRIKENGVYRSLTDEERQKVKELAFSIKELKYSRIRKELSLPDGARFKALTYGDSINKTENAIFVQLKYYHKLHALFKKADKLEVFHSLNENQLNSIGIALTLYKTDEDIRSYLEEQGIDREIIEIVLELSFAGFGNLSLKALKNINVHLEKGLTYDKACELAGYNFKGFSRGKKEKFLPRIPNEDITNPVVLRTLTQSRKVINAIIRRYGSPETIHIELAREMSHSHEERKRMMKQMEENRKINEQAIKELQSKYYQLQPSGHDIVKMKLWTQQNGFCVYSRNPIHPDRLFEPGYVEVDHIIPYSRSLDDSYNNKVLVLSSENQQKGNRIPYEYFGHDKDRWHEFEEWVKSSHFNRKKKANLLRKSFNEEDEREFLSKNLNDTRYAARFLKNFISENLLFSELGKGKQKVFTVNGPVTSFLRKRWGLTKIREENDRHHALDATVVALTSSHMIQQVTYYSKYKEIRYSKTQKHDDHLIDPETGEVFEKDDYRNPEVLKRFPLPWPRFREELEIRLNSDNPARDIEHLQLENYRGVDLSQIRPLFVSRMPIRKFTGQVHKETIYSAKLFEQGYVIKRVPLEEIKFDKNGDFDMYGKETDPYTYNAIKNRYLSFNKDAKKAFKEPLYKPKANGEQGPIIKKVKIYQRSNTGVLLKEVNGIAENGEMVRIDIFKKNNKFYIVPIYMADIIKKELPNKIIKAGVPRKDWPEVDKTYEFQFSLHTNDLVKIKRKDKEVIGYYRKCPGNQPSIYIDNHDNNDSKESQKFGITNAIDIEKYTVDPLGYYYKVKKEKRRGLA